MYYLENTYKNRSDYKNFGWFARGKFATLEEAKEAMESEYAKFPRTKGEYLYRIRTKKDGKWVVVQGTNLTSLQLDRAWKKGVTVPEK